MFCFFFFNDTATTEIYTLSLHDALPIWTGATGAFIGVLQGELERIPPALPPNRVGQPPGIRVSARLTHTVDRKSTRLNSSHLVISYAVFCLKKKKSNIAALLQLRAIPTT